VSNRPNNSSIESDEGAFAAPPMQPTMTEAQEHDDALAAASGAAAPVTRRQALKVLGAVPLAGAIGGAMSWEQATPVQGPEHPHAAGTARRSGRTAPPAKRSFFTAAEFRTAGVLADDIIPRDERSGSATEAGVPAFMDFHLGLTDTDENTRIAIRGGLAWLDRETRRRFTVPYARATTEQRHAILDDIAWPKKAKPAFSNGVAFFNRFRDMVASGYYSSAMGWQDLRYTGNQYVATWNGCPDDAMQKLGVSQDLMKTRIAPQ
jgi:gluconate 2-dehydrogenase gamma chain